MLIMQLFWQTMEQFAYIPWSSKILSRSPLNQYVTNAADCAEPLTDHLRDLEANPANIDLEISITVNHYCTLKPTPPEIKLR